MNKLSKMGEAAPCREYFPQWLTGYDIMMFGLLVLLGLLMLPELLSLLSLPVLSGLLPKGDPADEILQ